MGMSRKLTGNEFPASRGYATQARPADAPVPTKTYEEMQADPDYTELWPRVFVYNGIRFVNSPRIYLWDEND
jgi:hypothetical protein